MGSRSGPPTTSSAAPSPCCRDSTSWKWRLLDTSPPRWPCRPPSSGRPASGWSSFPTGNNRAAPVSEGADDAQGPCPMSRDDSTDAWIPAGPARPGHPRELANGTVQPLGLPSDPVDLGTLSIESDGGGPLSFDEFLDGTSTDGLVIISRGRVVLEHYANGMTPETPHILMSVSKSLLGLLAGVLAARGDLEPDRPVTDVLPEVAGTAYKGATIRQLLDMRAGV